MGRLGDWARARRKREHQRIYNGHEMRVSHHWNVVQFTCLRCGYTTTLLDPGFTDPPYAPLPVPTPCPGYMG
jgi:hypothetical protein